MSLSSNSNTINSLGIFGSDYYERNEREKFVIEAIAVEYKDKLRKAGRIALNFGASSIRVL